MIGECVAECCQAANCLPTITKFEPGFWGYLTIAFECSTQKYVQADAAFLIGIATISLGIVIGILIGKILSE
jgi:hypothetical protein